MANVTISGQELHDMICVAAAFLEKNKKAIDALNVFPVPDGDTGINMSLTLQTAAKEVREGKKDSVEAVGAALSLGSLKGARGNSGVILSQIFRGFGKALQGKQTMDAALLSSCMEMGVESAYKAVMKPKEGTILTVARMMSEAAKEAVKQNKDVIQTIDAMIEQGEKTLAQTPEMLPVLKEAGVVDSGGMGLLVIFKGFKMCLNGEKVPEAEITNLGGFVAPTAEEDNSDIEFGYCTEFFIKDANGALTEENAEQLRKVLGKIGDCVLVVGGGPLLKVHVHTNAPGQALQYGLRYGSLSSIKIDNMREMHRELENGADAEVNGLNKVVAKENDAPEPPKEQKELGVVAVVAGQGLCEVFSELGADQIIEGGQSMNPSIDDIAQAAKHCNAKHVFVLPNNKNIILAADQAAELLKDEVDVRVMPTKSIPQGMSALIALNPDNNVQDNAMDMLEAMEATNSCSITYAVRDTQLNGKEIKKGDILGMVNGDLQTSGQDVAQVCKDTIAKTLELGGESITMFYGEDVSQEEADALAEELEAQYPDFDVQMYPGGQQLYYYIVGIE